MRKLFDYWISGGDAYPAFHLFTTDDQSNAPPMDPVSQLQSLLTSVKTQMLTKLLQDIVIEGQRKVLVFGGWSPNPDLIETVVRKLGIVCRSIRSPPFA